MSHVDLDAFVRWVGARDVPRARLEAYRRGASEILACTGEGPVTAASVDAAVERAERSGRRATRLREIGGALLQFQAEPAAPASRLDPVSDPPPPSEARQLLVPLAVFLAALVAFVIVNALLYWLTGHVILPG